MTITAAENLGKDNFPDNKKFFDNLFINFFLSLRWEDPFSSAYPVYEMWQVGDEPGDLLAIGRKYEPGSPLNL
ncbi:hypothetical protein EO92_00155 [Methanosarcina sp. 2.H.A.1B.4]|nr:hypothetical protein EO92_00155 [Methanosarcina sp. 2.H.A.1B.4]